MLQILVDRLQPFLLILHAANSLVHLGNGRHCNLHGVVLLRLGVQHWRAFKVRVRGGRSPGVGPGCSSLALAGGGRSLRLHAALDVGPGDTAAGELGVLLGGAGAEIDPGLHLALAGVDCHLEGVEHDVGVPVLVLPLLDYFLVDQVPLRDRPAILADIFTQLRDGVVFAGVVSPGGSVVFLKYRLLALRRRQSRPEARRSKPSPTSHESAATSGEPHEASHLHLELRLHVEGRSRGEVAHLNTANLRAGLGILLLNSPSGPSPHSSGA